MVVSFNPRNDVAEQLGAARFAVEMDAEQTGRDDSKNNQSSSISDEFQRHP